MPLCGAALRAVVHKSSKPRGEASRQGWTRSTRGSGKPITDWSLMGYAAGKTVVGLDIEPGYVTAVEAGSAVSPSTVPRQRRWRPASSATARSSTSTRLADSLKKMFAEHKLAQARPDRRRQPADRDADGGPPTARSGQGPRVRGPLPGSGAHPDAARPGGPRAPLAWASSRPPRVRALASCSWRRGGT